MQSNGGVPTWTCCCTTKLTMRLPLKISGLLQFCCLETLLRAADPLCQPSVSGESEACFLQFSFPWEKGKFWTDFLEKETSVALLYTGITSTFLSTYQNLFEKWIHLISFLVWPNMGNFLKCSIHNSLHGFVWRKVNQTGNLWISTVWFNCDHFKAAWAPRANTD